MSLLLYILAGLATLIAVVFVVSRVKLKLARDKALVALEKTYSALQHPPTLKMELFFGYPALNVVFRNHLVLEEAKRLGLNDAFLREIDLLFAGYGPKRRPFRAEAAVGFSHENFLTRADIGIQ